MGPSRHDVHFHSILVYLEEERSRLQWPFLVGQALSVKQLCDVLPGILELLRIPKNSVCKIKPHKGETHLQNSLSTSNSIFDLLRALRSGVHHLDFFLLVLSIKKIFVLVYL